MQNITLGSLFDGIGGWLLAAQNAGVEPLWSSEIEKFPCAVTAYHFPQVQQLGDITKLNGVEVEPVDIVCAGSPCQDLSVAGQKKGLGGKRSGLFYTATEFVRQMRDATNQQKPRYFIWENVPGAFITNGGKDFRAVLRELSRADIPMPQNGKWTKAGMVQLPQRSFAWRVLDAEFFGVPQRRKRIFLVADFRGQSAGEILFESQGLQGNFEESKTEKQNTRCGIEENIGNNIAIYDMTHRDEVLRKVKGSKLNTLTMRMGTGGNQVPLIFSSVGFGGYAKKDIVATLTSKNSGVGHGDECLVQMGKGLRRLTPLECERAQGLPDNYTLVPNYKCSDFARYKAIGNGMAQPCADWVIKRIVEYGFK